MSEISIIILTFNSIKFVKSCLDSIFSQDRQNFETIVVDNGSNDGTTNFIKEKYPQVILIENKDNLGACKARNQGIEIARGKLVLTIDCDIVLERVFLSRIVEAIKIAPTYVGMIQPKILNFDKRTIYSCGIYLSWLRRFYDIGKGKFDNGQFDKPQYIFGACSAAALYRREMLEAIKEDIGYFDERFFFLVEDVDLAWRAQKKGWRTLYHPEAVCCHCGNSSSLNKSLRQFLCWRNRMFMLKKYRLNRFKLTVIYLFYDLPRLFVLFLSNAYVRNMVLNRNNGNIACYN